MTEKQAAPQSTPGDRVDLASDDSRLQDNPPASTQKVEDQSGTPGTPMIQAQANLLESSDKESTAIVETGKAELGAPPGGGMGPSPSIGGGSQIKDLPPSNSNNLAPDNAPGTHMGQAQPNIPESSDKESTAIVETGKAELGAAPGSGMDPSPSAEKNGAEGSRNEDKPSNNSNTVAADNAPGTLMVQAQPNLLESSDNESTAIVETGKAELGAPPGGGMDLSPGAEKNEAEGSHSDDIPSSNSNNTPPNNSLENIQAPPAKVHLPKASLKLDISNKEVSKETQATPLSSGITNITMPFPGLKIPQSPGVFDLQSPVVIIGEDVFLIIDDSPPPPAPFPHRFVSLRSGNVTDLYDLNMAEILGGGRFGEVHVCTEKATGMKLVAKVLKVQSERDREMALNEINVMNQLDHRNLIQMFDAVESPNEIFLLLEYVGGGELFERIIDDSYQLMEVDTMVFVRQICEGIFYMHQMYVLHLDLKPENIVCVSPISHMVKIIDYGLARRYKPKNKLKVSFGTPEFLSPEVINYDHVSFSTDMWSVGVITYMMVSGLSPFLGENDTETMNNILEGDPGFEEEPFEQVSEEAKDFISNLLVREKSGRMSAAQCLKHPWLNDLARKAKLCNRLLKSQMELRKYMMRRRWKKNIFAVAAANRFRKSGSSACLTSVAE